MSPDAQQCIVDIQQNYMESKFGTIKLMNIGSVTVIISAIPPKQIDHLTSFAEEINERALGVIISIEDPKLLEKAVTDVDHPLFFARPKQLDYR